MEQGPTTQLCQVKQGIKKSCELCISKKRRCDGKGERFCRYVHPHTWKEKGQKAPEMPASEIWHTCRLVG